MRCAANTATSWPIYRLAGANGQKNAVGRSDGRTAPFRRQRHRRMPGRLQVGSGERAPRLIGHRHDLGGRFVRLSGLLGIGRLVGEPLADELVLCAGAGFGALAERDRDLAAWQAGAWLTFAEAARVRYGGAGHRHRCIGIDFRVRRLCTAARQEQADDAKPERHSQQKEHDPPIYPRRIYPPALARNLADRLEAVVGLDVTIWLKHAANAMRIFRQFDMIEFASNFKYLRP